MLDSLLLLARGEALLLVAYCCSQLEERPFQKRIWPVQGWQRQRWSDESTREQAAAETSSDGCALGIWSSQCAHVSCERSVSLTCRDDVPQVPVPRNALPAILSIVARGFFGFLVSGWSAPAGSASDASSSSTTGQRWPSQQHCRRAGRKKSQ